MEAVLRAWCWLIRTTSILQRSELVIPVKTPAATHIPLTAHYCCSTQERLILLQWGGMCSVRMSVRFMCLYVRASSIGNCSVDQGCIKTSLSSPEARSIGGSVNH